LEPKEEKEMPNIPESCPKCKAVIKGKPYSCERCGFQLIDPCAGCQKQLGLEDYKQVNGNLCQCPDCGEFMRSQYADPIQVNGLPAEPVITLHAETRECPRCGFDARGPLPSRCPRCDFQSIAPCPNCQLEISIDEYETVKANLWSCPNCETRIFSAYADPFIDEHGALVEPLVELRLAQTEEAVS
jgi:predicted RNA-binding Zn-ribbon protein involved in translation (DUF1610 family)